MHALERTPGEPFNPHGDEPSRRPDARPPSLKIRIVAHASPRWRGAESAKDADQHNLQLSRDRAAAVRSVVAGDKLRASRHDLQVQWAADLTDDS